MVYKYNIEDDYWIIGKEVRFPDKTVINKDNRITKDGFEWFDKPPIKYIKWLKEKEEEENKWKQK